ncbi:ATP-binding protein [Corallibacter sp.]|uniref:ATP-binding protein n=1 Tax=Corallibacter sp. TaxID=2038084 RepID=UPI003AB44CF9
MKLSKFDIGAEIISIITKGMYPDPKDAIREYIQNGIDAHATEMSVKVRQESIVIADNGIGMNRDVLRKAVRVGVSDKNPTKDVGFMGIGIYSSFHLCSNMSIYSNGSNGIPNLLEMDFGRMKSILEQQKVARLNNEIDSNELIDLQTLLESCISLSEDGEFPIEEFPNKGTRVELSGIEPEFYSSLSDFEEVKFYLQNVIPLHFDKEKFSYADLIEDRINEICNSKDQRFEIIDLSLQINSQIESLYRPYTDSDFNSSVPPLPPQFETLENGEFFGIAWGCLNSVRRKLQNRQLRGFILKKQGFSIGRRENVVKFFPRGNTFFDRYSGEIIIVNERVLPNASRNDIEYSPLRTLFYDTLKEVADKFDDKGHKYQEESKAKEHLANINRDFKLLVGSYNEFETNPEILINQIVKIKRINDTLSNAIKRKGFDEESEHKAEELLQNIKGFEKTVQERVAYLAEEKKRVSKSSTTKNQIAKNVQEINIEEPSGDNAKYESLLDVIDDLELSYSEEFKQLIELIDEIFVQGVSSSKNEYYENLVNLKNRFEQE